MRSATYLRSYRGKQSVITVGKAMTSQQGGGRQPAGIRDVARLAGVSVASVSFALNGLPGVADDTRRRILAAADQLGYRANPQAQALRRGRTTTYGLVIRNFSNPFFLEVLTGAERAASEAGATLLLLDSHYSAERERLLIREMAAQRLAGLAIAPVGKGESLRLWQELRPGTPVVALNAAVEDLTGVSRVYPDNAAGVELAMRRLAELGHARVAFLSAPRGLVADPDRLRHFRRLARVLGLQPVDHALAPHDHRRAQGGRDPAGPPGCPHRRSSPTPITPRSASTRPLATCPCGSARMSPSSGTTTCRPRNCSTRRWRPSAWTARKWAGR